MNMEIMHLTGQLAVMGVVMTACFMTLFKVMDMATNNN